MNILLVLLLAAVIIAYTQRGRNPVLARKLMAGMTVVVLVLLGIRWYGGCRDEDVSHAATAGRRFQTAAGYMLGRHVADTVPGGGTILVLQIDPSSAISRAQVGGISQGAGGAFQVTTDAMGLPDSDDAMMMDGATLSTEQLAEFIAGNPDADAVITCIGLPFSRRGIEFPDPMPPFFSLEVPDPDVAAQLMHEGILHGFLVYRHDVDWSATAGRRMEMDEIFDMRFKLVTPENYRDVLTTH